jgi:hypothetical protein
VGLVVYFKEAHILGTEELTQRVQPAGAVEAIMAGGQDQINVLEEEDLHTPQQPLV